MVISHKKGTIVIKPSNLRSLFINLEVFTITVICNVPYSDNWIGKYRKIKFQRLICIYLIETEMCGFSLINFDWKLKWLIKIN